VVGGGGNQGGVATVQNEKKKKTGTPGGEKNGGRRKPAPKRSNTKVGVGERVRRPRGVHRWQNCWNPHCKDGV